MNTKQLLIGVLFAACFISMQSPGQNFWQVLAEVGFTSKKDKNGYQVETPVFSATLKSFHGKKVKLKGYVIPVSEVGDSDKFMLSSLPFNVCYFCGAAGPETVVEVESSEKIKFSSKAIWMEGILQLNDKDPDHHMFILKSARSISVTGTTMKDDPVVRQPSR
ncbi:MAG: hypothetical protein DI538_06085 [Azospira oryzae]|jgi:hypothetical protein|nr:MAG: hypothetical protein DI538_06085 [Azospira oryzae]